MLPSVRYVGAAGDYVQVKPGTAGSVNLVGYDDSVIDFYVPVFTILQFIFYFGWLQVAETLINPFGGADDEDFDVFFLINRNFQLGFIMIQDNKDEDNLEDADECDLFGDENPPAFLPEKFLKKERTERKVSVTAVEKTTTSIKMIKLNEVTSNSMENLVELFEK